MTLLGRYIFRFSVRWCRIRPKEVPWQVGISRSQIYSLS